MRIEHIAMYVENLEDAKNFFKNILMQYQVKNIIIKKQISVRIF